MVKVLARTSSFDFTSLIYYSFSILRGVHLSIVLSSRYAFPLQKISQNLKALCTGGMEVPICEHFVETICIQ
jgi:hypothetical protein